MKAAFVTFAFTSPLSKESADSMPSPNCIFSVGETSGNYTKPLDYPNRFTDSYTGI